MRVVILTTVAIMGLSGALLSGCGNDSKDTVSLDSIKPATDDSFITVVKQQTNGADAQSETNESIDIAQINATAPENTEPQSVSF